MSVSDQEILALACIPGEKEQAFSLLVKKYQQRLYWHLRKMLVVHEDADDVLQNTFVKAWQNLDQFRGDSSIYTWMYRIATNEALNFLNKKRAELINNPEDLEVLLSKQLDNDPLYSSDEMAARLLKSVLSLRDKQRQAINRKCFADTKYDVMTQILETPVGALIAYFYHAVRKIEALIDQELLDRKST